MGCFSYLRDKIWHMFGWNRKKVGPAAETSMDFPGIDPKDLELKTLARLMSMVYPRGTEDRWKCLDERMRQELAEPGENWEEKKAYSAKALIAMSRKVYSLRKEYVEIQEAEVSKYLARFDMMMIGPQAQAELAGVEDGANSQGTTVVNEKEDASQPPPQKPPKAPRDFSNGAMKALSMAERSERGMRDEGYEHGEIEPSAFFNLLYRLKAIHGHMLPMKKKPDKDKKKGDDADEKVVADSFFDIGCGSGKAVFAAAIFFEFKACRGVEAISSLHSAATDLKERWTEEVAEKVLRKNTEISFELGDMVESSEWESATYFYMNGPTFSEGTLHKLGVKFNGKTVPPESILVAVGRPYDDLDKDKWSVLAEDIVQMTWGKTKVYVYEKLPAKKKQPINKKQKSKRDSSA